MGCFTEPSCTYIAAYTSFINLYKYNTEFPQKDDAGISFLGYLVLVSGNQVNMQCVKLQISCEVALIRWPLLHLW